MVKLDSSALVVPSRRTDAAIISGLLDKYTFPDDIKRMILDDVKKCGDHSADVRRAVRCIISNYNQGGKDDLIRNALAEKGLLNTSATDFTANGQRHRTSSTSTTGGGYPLSRPRVTL